eukprot:Nitzschia sp. Nitz4//scaffold4_size323378//306915//309716//NITZ4_000716-RA/size323378-processed-gene-0.392-mRNA-1//-1//CDS//3329553567//8609//frame0
MSTGTSSSRWTPLDEADLIRLEFEDFVDLQTRLVLMPRVVEEGTGAVVSVFHPRQVADNSTEELETLPGSTAAKPALSPKQDSAEPSQEHPHNLESPVPDESTTGCVLLGLESQRQDWKEEEFTSILASLRTEKNLPLRLVFEIPKSDEKSTETAPAEPPTQSDPVKTEMTPSKAIASSESLQSGMLALSAWGMRMRAQATEAATTLSSAAKEHAKQFNVKEHTSSSNSHCGIYLQTSVGAFVPVDKAQKVTTSSLLLLRKSATEAAPTNGWSFQWYRNRVDESPGSEKDSEAEWIALEGATNAAFQPNATLVGRRLQCIVSIPESRDPVSSDDDSDDESSVSSTTTTHTLCEMTTTVLADTTLFNGARNALLRGASFGGMKGLGNAEGRQFRIEVSIGLTPSKHDRHPCSAVQIFQISGSDNISLTAKPILQATADVPSSDPKALDLILSAPPDSVLSALCSNGCLKLEAANRFSRESLLMTLGIANYRGKPAEMDVQTVLFQDSRSNVQSLLDDDFSKSSDSSEADDTTTDSPEPSPQTPTKESPPVETETPSKTPERVGPPASPQEDQDTIALQREIEMLRSKLSKKDTAVADLKQQLTKFHSASESAQQALQTRTQELHQSQQERDRLQQSILKSEQHSKNQENKIQRMEDEHKIQVSILEDRLQQQSTRILELEKANKALQNEKAVVQAAVDAREAKLTKMGELQASFEELSIQVAKHDAIRVELETSNRRYDDIRQALEKVEEVEKKCRKELEVAKVAIDNLTAQVAEEQKTAAVSTSKLDILEKKVQQLRGERNSLKQKNDSLSKEIAHLCKNGRSIKDIERVLVDYQVVQDEVENLRKQKRKAMEEAHTYRTSFEKARAAHEMLGVESETRAALERNAELERLLAEMTEYVNAKEMQMETMKLVNEHLQHEIHSLAKANLNKNEV